MGDLVNVRTFTSNGVFRPSFPTRKIIVEVQGGGGGGGGTAATSSGQGAASSGGTAGAYARAVLYNGFDEVAVTVGLGGAAGQPGLNDGGAGGTSSFGSYVVAPGGLGGQGGPASPGPIFIGANWPSNPPTGGNLISAIGAQGAQAFMLTPNSNVGGTGAGSYFGGGGVGGSGAVGGVAASPGAGGGGSSSTANQAGRPGGAGVAGIVLVYEYS